MARTGLFGRAPRALPSLTATLLAIARAQQNQEDQNIMDAWQKGGNFEGRPATDEAILKHWQNRLKDVSHDDALYDTYKNTITQFEYSIAESKMTVGYAQNKVSDKAAAAFYLNWAKKIPVNSEFYRVLQRDAAQYLNAARNKSRAGAARLAEQQYQNSQNATSRKYGAAGDYLTSVITGMAKNSAIINRNQDLGNIDLSDPEVLFNLMQSVNSTVDTRSGENRPYSADAGKVLFIDPQTNKPVTVGDVRTTLGKLDPHFNGAISLDYYGNLLRQKQQGLVIMAGNATKTGHASDAAQLQNAQYANTATAQSAAAWSTEEAYKKANDAFNQVWEDKNTTIGAKMAARGTYEGFLSKTAANPKTDPVLSNILRAELNGSADIESLAVQMGGAKPGDGAVNFAFANSFRDMQDQVATGKAIWTVGAMDSKGVFTPGKGKDIGAATPQQVAALSPIQSVTVYLPQGQGLPDMPVTVAGQRVTAQVTDQTGAAVPTTTTNEQTVATVYNLPGGPEYAFQNAQGQTLFTKVPPWSAGTMAEVKDDGSVVLHTVVNPNPQQTQGDNAPYAIARYDANGNPVFAVHPQNLIFDPARTAAPNPMTDSFSPTIAYRVNDTDGTAALRTLYQNDPAFRAQVDNEAHFYGAGQQPITDPKTGAIIGWQGTSPTSDKAYSSAMGATSLLLTPPSSTLGDNTYDETVRSTLQMQGRAPWDSFMYGSATPPGTPNPNGAGGATGITALPSDMSRGTQFNALSSYWSAGTNNPAPAPVKHSGPTVKTGLNITVPQVGPVPPPPNPAKPPSDTVTGSTSAYTTPYSADPDATYKDAANKFGPGY